MGSIFVRTGVGMIAFIVICFLAYLIQPSTMVDGKWLRWYAVVPPVLAVIVALVTRKVLLSLGSAILIGGLLKTVPDSGTFLSWGTGVVQGATYFTDSATDSTNVQILLFVILVMMMIAVLSKAGGIQGIVNWLVRFANNSKSTQLTTVAMGLALFIDDYANTMMVGTTFRPISDRHQVSREKLAFIVDATSAPVAGIAVISTWIGYEVGLFGEAAKSLNIAKEGYAMFFDALSFRFYCIMMITFVIVNALSGRDFGPMARAQKRAEKEGKLLADNATPMTSKAFSASHSDPKAKISAWSALVPLFGLFAFLFIGLWIDGGGGAKFAADGLALFKFTVWREVLSASENSILLLAWAAGIGLGLATFFSLALSQLHPGTVLKTLFNGAVGSWLPVLILILAWSLKGACDGLHTGAFLANTLSGVFSPLWFPALLFLISALTAFATGTSWGTMAILIPTAIPLAFQLDGSAYGLTTMISLGAILDGAIMGDHCSPISDTTILSSIASNCDHIHHVETQIPYSLTVALLALVCGYLPAAAGIPSWVGMVTAGVVILTLFFGILRPESHPKNKTLRSQNAAT